MKKILTLLFVFATLAVQAQKPLKNNVADPAFKGLDTAFERVLKTWKTAGFAVAVVKKNKIIYAKGFGYRDVEQKLPATANTVFAIGSSTKAFTASLIGLLQKDGKVDFDKPVNSFMPSLRFYNDAMNNAISLRDMMSHRTGLPRHDLSWYLFTTLSRDSILQRIQYQEPTAQIRQTWQYNNFMYTALGAIDEKLTGKTWEQNLSEYFFKPLGMNNTNTSIAELEKSKEPAKGYEVYRDSIIRKQDYYHINAMAPAGAINSTANDMANWLITWINGGKFNGKEIFSSNYYTQAISSQMVINASLPSEKSPDVYFSNYGFGWFLNSYKGHYRVDHGGNIDGFSANAAFFPADSLGIVVLVNQNGSPVPSIVRNIIADRMLKLKYVDWNSKQKSEVDKAKAGQKNIDTKTAGKKKYPAVHELKDFAGIYSHPGYGSLKVFMQHDSLFAHSINYTFWLRHNTYDVFDILVKDRVNGIDTANVMTKLQFQMNSEGDIERLSGLLEQGLKPIVFTKGLDEKPIEAKDLKKYIGEYTLGNMLIKIYDKGAKTLYAFIAGQPEYELVSLGSDKFGIKVLTGYYLQFNLNPAGNVTDAVFMQPNGNFKAVKK